MRFTHSLPAPTGFHLGGCMERVSPLRSLGYSHANGMNIIRHHHILSSDSLSLLNFKQSNPTKESYKNQYNRN